ncbi:uncharacterized protein LOC6728625 [Drosophila simulans]|uniref:GD18703 n=1 Tax=Drosophila simulans TaxID=7240 RepID=B4QV63_DROSI|nr:uncharacterized protein LOC6728625 [Drosophila simulans]EDX13469.1 GD18703 [Drosophila simulans]KMZ04398.1 uncharacterized protein Dsimw501_GD18703 [Drosophila simulans]
MFRRTNADPVIRQFILRTAVLNYLGKSLREQYNEYCLLGTQHEKLSLKTASDQELEALPTLFELFEMQQLKTAATHRLLMREYQELLAYMMDKSDLWDSQEYFKAKSALGAAIQNLRVCAPTKPMD